MEGKFNLKYFLTGAGITDWFKAWGLGWRLILTLVIIFFVGITIYRAFFKGDTVVNVGRGGTAIIQQVRKRFFIPFIEGGIEQRRTQDMTTYIRAGLRFEF